MGGSKRCVLVALASVTMLAFLLYLTVPPLDTYVGDIHVMSSPPAAVPRLDTYKDRLAWISHQCKKLGLTAVAKSLAFEPGLNVYSAPKHKLVFCAIPKITSTTWKRALIALEMAPPGSKADMQQFNVLPKNYPHTDSKVGKYVQRLSTIKDSRQKAAILSNADTKFMFVRHPFTRLLSAYRDKIADDAGDIGFRKWYLSEISKHVGWQHAGGKISTSVSFVQFLNNVFRTPTERFDIHWARMVDVCNPCVINYDFVGKQESMRNDSAELLRRTGLAESIDFPVRNATYKKATSSDDVTLMRTYYKKVPLYLARQLHAKYEADFLLFNYTFPDELFA
ncbi:PREDICTED: carbohydrate sulfotransferase 12-like [Priapulus caudatus]|uniref:Carbohydrate sulfotransferase n=1 Tax=Priapulus caudatus TaxID=37621 RepID=A0ABM1F4P9_PRICU|nr:PREDICTED: carbohydrate sulfotransferase 12-like [Priapulus caudatus]